MNTRYAISIALLAASLVAVEPSKPDTGPAKKAKGKVTPPPKQLPKLQSASLRRMLRKAKP